MRSAALDLSTVDAGGIRYTTSWRFPNILWGWRNVCDRILSFLQVVNRQRSPHSWCWKSTLVR